MGEAAFSERKAFFSPANWTFMEGSSKVLHLLCTVLKLGHFGK
jgi:hypothetical protein